jgi:RNA polymerase sigma factor (TIGR02999 family)
MHDVIPLVYEELKALARAHLRREAVVPFETTALVHEAFLRLARGRHPSYENRAHFYGIASRLMRQVLVETARSRATRKRDAARELALADVPDRELEPDRSVLAIDAALQELERADPRKSELIQMRYFGGMTAEESSTALSMPVHVVRRELRLAEVWLRKEMTGEDSDAELRRGRKSQQLPAYDPKEDFEMVVGTTRFSGTEAPKEAAEAFTTIVQAEMPLGAENDFG